MVFSAPLQTSFYDGTIAPMKCPVCRKEFVAIRADAQYCGVNCRSQAYRLRLRTAARREVAGDDGTNEDSTRSGKRAELLTAATGRGKGPRVALEQQVLSQVPPRAYRYCLVLGVIPQRSEPVMAPEQGGWSLMPFEAPSDSRLLSGQTYRIVWLDRDGEAVPPLEWAPAPCLHFFLGEPDAEISAEQVERRYQAQTVMQLRRQVQELEEKLARAERKLRRTKKALRAFKRRAHDRIRLLKQLHKRDSVKTFISDWGPVVAVGAGLYLLMRNRRTKTARVQGTNQESTPTEPQSDTPEQPRSVETEEPRATERVHSLANSFHMLTQLVESSESPPTQLELARLSQDQIWPQISRWLERSSFVKKGVQPAPSTCAEWKGLYRVSAATSALAFMSETLLAGESGKTQSACSRSLLQACVSFDHRFRAWLVQCNVNDPPQPSDYRAAREFAAELVKVLRAHPPGAGDAFGQVLHDSIMATQIRLSKALGERAEPTTKDAYAADSDVAEFLREFAAVHGPQVLQRAVRDLVRKWTGTNLPKSPGFSDTTRDDEDKDGGAAAA